MADISLMGTDV